MDKKTKLVIIVLIIIALLSIVGAFKFYNDNKVFSNDYLKLQDANK